MAAKRGFCIADVALATVFLAGGNGASITQRSMGLRLRTWVESCNSDLQIPIDQMPLNDRILHVGIYPAIFDRLGRSKRSKIAGEVPAPPV